MRVSQNTNFNTVRGNISRSKERLEGLQNQAASLKKLNAPSDDPVGAAKVLQVRTEKVNNDQFIMNAKMAQTHLENSEHSIAELADIIVRAKEIALGQASGAGSNEETRIGIAEEISQLFQQSVAIGNKKIADRYLFGGYKTNTPPIDADGKYLGDDGQMMSEIAKDVFVTVNLPGIEVFNTAPKHSNDAKNLYGPEKLTQSRSLATSSNEELSSNFKSQENINLFDELQYLRVSLLTGDIEGIRSSLERFDELHAKLNGSRAKIGSRINGLENASQAMERHNITNAQLTSNIEDADMVKVMTDLAKEESVLKSTMQASQKLIQPTLMDFLR